MIIKDTLALSIVSLSQFKYVQIHLTLNSTSKPNQTKPLKRHTMAMPRNRQREKTHGKMGECNITNCTFRMQHNFRIQLIHMFHMAKNNIGFLGEMKIHGENIYHIFKIFFRNVFIITKIPFLGIGSHTYSYA